MYTLLYGIGSAQSWGRRGAATARGAALGCGMDPVLDGVPRDVGCRALVVYVAYLFPVQFEFVLDLPPVVCRYFNTR